MGRGEMGGGRRPERHTHGGMFHREHIQRTDTGVSGNLTKRFRENNNSSLKYQRVI